MQRNRTATVLISLAIISGWSGVSRADDYPQWRGRERDGHAQEKGLLKTWPEGGPKLLWKIEGTGEGHSTPSVAKGRIYGMGLRDGAEIVWALDEKTGKEVWAKKIADEIRLNELQGGFGSRATPTVDGDRIYTLGVGGELLCLKTKDGEIVWRKNLVMDFGGNVPAWGYSESPLVDGDRVIVTPGSGTATIVALNKKTGDTLWKSQVADGNGVSYSSAIAANYAGKRQYIQFLTGAVVGVDASTGATLWSFASPACRQGINCSTPLFQNGMVFAASAYQNGGALGKLSQKEGKIAVEEVYFSKEMQNHHGGMVLVDGYLYGFDNSNLTCLEFATGKIMWTNRSVGKGSVAYADGLLYCRSERGPVAIVEANPKEYVEKGRLEQPNRSSAPSWPYPVIANGKLYLRDMNALLCYDVTNSGGGK
jgi:outer membrane protein assembly factor BamB